MEYGAIIGIAGFALMLSLIVIGVPIFISMLLPSIIGFWMLGGYNFMITQLKYGPFGLTENYMFAVIPMFVLIGQLAAESGLADAAFRAINSWVGKLRGGPLMTVIGANAVFGAVSSTPLAMAVVNIKVALPRLMQNKYDKHFCLATIATSGVLTVLMPPSTAIVIFCILTNVSIGRALVAGIIPCIALTIIYFLTVWVYGRIYPNKVPIVEMDTSWRERFSSLPPLMPILLIFAVMIGGIYMGIFPPTVGGAIGAAATLIYAFIRRVKMGSIVRAIWETVIINSQLFIMMVAGFMFSRFIALTNMTDYLVDFVAQIQAPPLVVMAVVVVVYILISFPLDLVPVLIVTLPIFFPLLTSIGFDPFVIVIVLVILGILADLTPPIGMNIWVIGSLAKVNVMEVYRGVVPWFIITFIFMWIIILWPPLTTWLPNLFYQ